MASASALIKGIILIAIVGCLAACRSPKDPILALLDDLKKAAESRDAGAVVAKLTEDFQGGPGTRRADVRPMLERYFLAYEKVNIEIYQVEVERSETTATLRFRADFNGRPRAIGSLAGWLPPSAMFRFELGLRQTKAGWQVAQAEWEEVPPAGQ